MNNVQYKKTFARKSFCSNDSSTNEMQFWALFLIFHINVNGQGKRNHPGKINIFPFIEKLVDLKCIFLPHLHDLGWGEWFEEVWKLFSILPQMCLGSCFTTIPQFTPQNKKTVDNHSKPCMPLGNELRIHLWDVSLNFIKKWHVVIAWYPKVKSGCGYVGAFLWLN